ncbi:Uncharacterized protein RDABS01_036628 [Bienertia sinuspersici]
MSYENKNSSGLILKEEAEEIVECEKEESVVMREQLQLCLVGKLLSQSLFGFEELKKHHETSMEDSECDGSSIGDGRCPWYFDGFLLLLKKVEQNVQPSEVTFDTILFWLMEYDFLLDKRTDSIVMSMAPKMGTFVEYDEFGHFGWKKYMGFRVDLKLNKPLRKGI